MKKEIKVCDRCKKSLENLAGISVQGNIYVPVEEYGGVVGNKLISTVEGNNTDICAKCFLEAVHIELRDELRRLLTPKFIGEPK